MSEERSAVRRALVRPAEASYGTRSERVLSALAVGTLAGVLASMATYTLRLQEIAPAWAGDTAMAAIVFLSGVLLKLLCEHLRTSVLALGVATVLGVVVAFAGVVAPYVLLDISTLGGIALLPSLRDAVTFVIFGQIPLQFTGYLVAIVYEGMTA